MIGHRQQFLNPCRHPLFAGNVVAARSVEVPAGVISFFKMTAGVADLPVGAEVPAPAVFYVILDLVFAGDAAGVRL